MRSQFKNLAKFGLLITTALNLTSCNIDDPSAGPFQFSVVDIQDILSEDDIMIWGSYQENNLPEKAENIHLFIGESYEKGVVMQNHGKQWLFEAGKNPKWPMGENHFNCYLKAISPAQHESFKIVQIPYKEQEYKTILAEISIPFDVSKHKDIKVGFSTLLNYTFYSSCLTKYEGSLLFTHILSQVKFTGISYSKTQSLSLSSIEIVNVHRQGFSGSMPEAVCTQLDKAKNRFTAMLANETVLNETSKQELTHPQFPLIMLPQTVAKWTTTAKNPVPTSEADANHNSYLKLVCTIYDKATGDTIANDLPVFIPFDVKWKKNYQYEYTILFGKESACFDQDGNALNNIPIQIESKQSPWEP